MNREELIKEAFKAIKNSFNELSSYPLIVLHCWSLRNGILNVQNSPHLRQYLFP